MNNILNCAKLDFYLIKRYWSGVLVLAGFGVMMGVAFKSGIMLSSYFLIMLCIFMSYNFAITEKTI